MSLGVTAIALCLDDVEPGTTPPGFPSLAAAHLWLVDGLRAALAPHPSPRRPCVSSWCRPTTGPRAPAPTPPTPPTSRVASPPTSTSSGPAPSSATTTSPPRRPARPPTCSGGGRSSGSTTPRTTRSASRSSSRRTDSRPRTWPPETAGLLLNSTRQVGLARLDALIVAAYLADPASYDHEQAVHQAVVDLLGEAAAPPFERLMDAWRAVPDVRTLTQDLQAGGRPFLDALLARLRPALATLDAVMPQLDSGLADRQIWSELVAGVDRLRLLVDALSVLDSELTASSFRCPRADRLVRPRLACPLGPSGAPCVSSPGGRLRRRSRPHPRPLTPAA